jgi:hypothetical protein
MKEVVDMTPEEYKKFIFQSGVGNDTHGGGKIITMSAEGDTAVRKKLAIGILIGAPIIGIVAPLLMKGTKDEKMMLAFFGGVFGFLLGAGLSVVVLPSSPKQ